MDDHFTLGINTNMEILDININPSLGNINSSHAISDHEFFPLSPNNFSENQYQRHDHSLPFIPLADGTNENPNFDFNSDHQAAGSFYDPITYLPTTTNDMAKRIAGEESLENSNRLNFSSGENKAKRNNHGRGRKKRKKNNDTAVEKPREVVHVRARRGEATDSHSLAERMRREKIKGKLRCLQELVPGCYKTMRMSVMFDVTMNYIQSLQNQIEFLSMKLSAASMFYDFNSPEIDAWDTTMKGANEYEAQVMDRMGGEGYGDHLLQFQSTWPL